MQEKYYLRRGDQIKGPFSLEKIRDLEAGGKLRDSDLFSTRNDGGWKSLRNILANSGSSRTPSSRSVGKSRSRMYVWVGISIFALIATTAVLWQFHPWKTEPVVAESQTHPVKPDSASEKQETGAFVTRSEPESGPEESEQAYKDGLKIRLSDKEVLTISGSDSRIESRLMAAMFRVLTEDMKFSVVFRCRQTEQPEEIPADRVTVVIQPPKIQLFEGVNGCAFPLIAGSAERTLDVVTVAFIRSAHANSFETGQFSTSSGIDLAGIGRDLRNIAKSAALEKKSHFEYPNSSKNHKSPCYY